MNRYQIYGIGNALVDIEFETKDEELQALSVDKGRMTLVTADRQLELLVNFGERGKKRACGGSAANTVIGATQLGAKCFYSCKVANDDTGRFYFEDLLRHGVDTNLTRENLPPGFTGTCLVFITPDAERSMNTHLGVTETLSGDALNEAALTQSEFLYIEGYLATSPPGRAAAIRARKIAEESGVKTSITFSDPNIVEHFRAELLEMVGKKVDLLFCNRSEAMLFSQTNDLEKAISELKEIARTFAVTLGPQGSLVFDGSTLHEIKAFPVDAIDTNGAGDLFAGAFLAGLSSGHSYPHAAKLANFASSRLVGKYGPRLAEGEIEIVRRFHSEQLSR